MKRMTYIVIALLLTIFASIAMGQQVQGDGKIDFVRMQNDLDIMEGILDKLLDPVDSGFWSIDRKTRGFYLDDYGVIFAVPVSKPFGFRFSVPTVPSLRGGVGYIITSEDDDEEIDSGEEEFIDMVREKVEVFLGEYADAIGQLNPENRVTVFLNESSDRRPLHLLTAKKKDIIAYRSGEMDEDDFHGSIKHTSLVEKTDLSSQIDIMAYILNSTLRNRSSNTSGFFLNNQSVNGLYLDDYGALFLVSANGAFGSTVKSYTRAAAHARIELERLREDLSERTRPDKKRARVESMEAEYVNQIEKVKKELEEYKASFSTLIGNYGHTLRLVNENEWIGVITNWGGQAVILDGDANLRGLIIKVRKKDVSDFNKGKLKESEFINRVQYIEY